MTSIAKLIAISSCCLAIGATAVNAEPTVLADAELDRITAGTCAVQGQATGPCGSDTGGVAVRELLPVSLTSPFSRLGFPGLVRDPNDSMPVAPPARAVPRLDSLLRPYCGLACT